MTAVTDSLDPVDSRLPLDAECVAAALAAAGWTGPQPVLHASVGSTNAEAESLARAGAPEGTSVVGEEQTAGRGRLDRVWVSPPGAGLWLSYLVRPGTVPVELWGWLPLTAGVAARDAVRTACRVPVELKWPNDLVVTTAVGGAAGTITGGPRKLAGILSEAVGDAVVLGIGINVALDSEDLPTPQATSVQVEGGALDRTALLAALLPALAHRLDQWRHDIAALRDDYRAACATIGRPVEVQRPGGAALSGTVMGVDDRGHLLVDAGGVVETVNVGDVVHASL